MVEQVGQSKNWAAIGAAAMAVVGACTIAYTVKKSNSHKRKAQEIFMKNPHKKDRKVAQYDDDLPLFLSKQQPRRVVLYFDQNDELVDEEIAKTDQNNYYHKYHAVEVDYGSNSMLEGIDLKDKITKDIFCGEQNTENAQIFLDVLEKSRARHQKKQMD